MFGNDDNQQQPASGGATAWPAVSAGPVAEPAATQEPTPVTDVPALSTPEASAPELPATTAPSEPANPDELVGIKQQALQHLSPLVGHLDQTPEEKFRTTMMMIQASDDQTLVKSAFEAAQLITDDKARAQALLDVINEINYFTQRQPAA